MKCGVKNMGASLRVADQVCLEIETRRFDPLSFSGILTSGRFMRYGLEGREFAGRYHP